MSEIIFLLFVFVLVIGLAYFITKKIGSIGALRTQGKNMRIIETLQLGINQVMYLVEVGDKIVIIGVSKDKMTYLSEVDSKSIDLSVYEMPNTASAFEDYLKKVMPKKK